MAIEKRIARNGSVSYRARLRPIGFPPICETFDNLKDAKRWQLLHKANLANDKHFPNTYAKNNTVASLIEKYLASLEISNPRRHAEVKPMLDWWTTELGSYKLSHFTAAHVLKGQVELSKRRSRKKDGEGNPVVISPARNNRYLIVLKAALGFGVKPLKWITENPVSDVPLLEEPEGRTRYLQLEEIDALLSACRDSDNPYLFNIVIIAISTGARKSEIRNLSWAHVNPDCTAITLPKTKAKKVRSILLTEKAVEVVNLISVPSCPAEAIRHYLDNALSESTRRAYRNDLDHYRAWGGVVPSSAEMIAAYLSAFAGTLSMATLARRIVAISKAHTMQGHPDPTKSDLAKMTFKGIRRVHGKPQVQVSPALREDLIQMLA